jgi:subtilase family serine protease
LIAFALFFSVSYPRLYAQGQGHNHGHIVVPDSSIEHLADHGKRAHTNHLILVPDRNPGAPSPAAAVLSGGETPSSLRQVYNIPDTNTGGSNVIVIVDAYHYPTALNDFNTFSTQFGLPTCQMGGCFNVIYQSGTQPPTNCGWSQEAALDIEWAHAMAPQANIVLVEANSNSLADLITAVRVGSNYITAHGGKGELSMSWGAGEFFFESLYDSYFNTTGVVYFASSGDAGGKTIWPSTSSKVVAAGGTTVNRDATGKFIGETGWSGSGGGPSRYISRPSYQSSISTITGSKRGVPDMSFDSDPYTGVAVYDSTPCNGMSGWLVFGGTSVASPSLAGIVNLAGNFSSSSTAELTTIYNGFANSGTYPLDFRDIQSGTAGTYSCKPGWDFVTGVGSDQGLIGK